MKVVTFHKGTGAVTLQEFGVYLLGFQILHGFVNGSKVFGREKMNN